MQHKTGGNEEFCQEIGSTILIYCTPMKSSKHKNYKHQKSWRENPETETWIAKIIEIPKGDEANDVLLLYDNCCSERA